MVADLYWRVQKPGITVESNRRPPSFITPLLYPLLLLNGQHTFHLTRAPSLVVGLHCVNLEGEEPPMKWSITPFTDRTAEMEHIFGIRVEAAPRDIHLIANFKGHLVSFF